MQAVAGSNPVLPTFLFMKRFYMTAVHNGKHSAAQSKRLIYSIIIVAITMFMEIVGGIISHSLALLPDAGHMLTYLFALVLSWLAHRFSAKKSDLQRSYGYHRLQIIAAFVNGLTLFLIAVNHYN